MKVLTAAAATLVAVGTTLVGMTTSASAVTEHCADYQSPDKVELTTETTTVDLPAGSVVCYKAGTQVFTVTVGDDGVLTSQATNRNGQLLGISYYIVLDSPPPPV